MQDETKGENNTTAQIAANAMALKTGAVPGLPKRCTPRDTTVKLAQRRKSLNLILALD